jgi:hypothetical protein
MQTRLNVSFQCGAEVDEYLQPLWRDSFVKVSVYLATMTGHSEIASNYERKSLMLFQCGWLTHNPTDVIFTCSTQYPSRWNGIYNPSLLVKKIHNFLCSPHQQFSPWHLVWKVFQLLQIPFQKQLWAEPSDMPNLGLPCLQNAWNGGPIMMLLRLNK